MFKEKLVDLFCQVLISPILICEKILIASGRGPTEYELKKFAQIECVLENDMLLACCAFKLVPIPEALSLQQYFAKIMTAQLQKSFQQCYMDAYPGVE